MVSLTWRLVAHLHRSVWQRLPRHLRRRGLEFLFRCISPKPSPQPDGRGPICVAGVFQSPSGLGHSARLCLRAFSKAGYETRLFDLSGVLFARRGTVVPSASARWCKGPGTVVVHVNAPLLPLALWRLGRSRVQGKLVVGYWAWELPQAPLFWRPGFDFVHEVWVPSQFVADALGPLAPGKTIRIVPHPIALDADDAPNLPRSRAKSPRFTVLVAFDLSSGFTRKNPLGAIDAFHLAFGNDHSVLLILKVMRPDAYPQGMDLLRARIQAAGNISLHCDVLEHQEFLHLLASADVLISLHRSEGFGLVLAEAMMVGTNVIATNWSGCVDFLDDSNSIPVPYSLINAIDPQGEYDHRSCVWAEPDVRAAARALRALHFDPALGASLSRKARRDILDRLGPEHYVRAITAAFKNHSVVE